jgi:hypothetical protein
LPWVTHRIPLKRRKIYGIYFKNTTKASCEMAGWFDACERDAGLRCALGKDSY